MAETLTPSQRRAVEHRGSKLLVSAAAGSGKTKVLVDRLMGYLTEETPSNLDDFLMITYTKAAATELRGKIAKKLSERIAEEPDNRHLQQQLQRLYLAEISTVHGFCGDVLRQYAFRLDLPVDFRVADENECAQLRRQVLDALLEQSYAEPTEDFQILVDTQGYGRDDKRLGEILLRVYDSARCHRSPDAYLQACLDSADLEGTSDASETVWGAYLISEFHKLLDHQIAFYSWAIKELSGEEKIQSALDNLGQTLHALEILRSFTTWREIHDFGSISYGVLRFPKNLTDEALKEQIKSLRDGCKESLAKALRTFTDDSDSVLDGMRRCGGAQKGLITLVRRFEAEFARKKRAARILDFSDLEHQMLRLLLGSSDVPTLAAREIGEHFREIMVDEYQDSNEVQDAIFGALTRERNNLFMVGDVKQSIYQFRLADPSIFLDKYKNYSDDFDKHGTRVLLSANFRSGPEVVEAVNAVFRTCMRQEVGGLDYTEAESLVEGVPHEKLPEPGVELACIESGSDAYVAEASFVAERISEMLKNRTLIRDGDGLRPVQAEDIVILLRSPGSVGGDYRRALEAKGIPCNTGSGDPLLETAEIATLRSVLQVISNPRQDIPLICVLASPVFGFTADDLARIRSVSRRVGLYDALTQCGDAKAVHFLETLKALRGFSRTHRLTELLQKVLNLTKLDSIYGAMPSGSTRTENIRSFFTLACEYETAAVRTLEQFLDHLDALQEQGITTATAPTGVTMMSIHKSKGLEFPVVFLCGLTKRFNAMDQRADILCHKDMGLGLFVVDNEKRLRYPSVSRRAITARMNAEMVSEEMRVLYVAMTRARDRLIMTCTAKNMASRLQDLTMDLAFDGGYSRCADTNTASTWILLTALRRSEAGQLHNAAGAFVPGQVSGLPWKITYHTADDTSIGESILSEKAFCLPEGARDKLREQLSFVYPYSAAVTAPSKQTATGRSDSFRAEEALEHTSQKKVFSHRVPAFVSKAVDGRAYGTAMHLCMQHIDFTACGDEASVRDELKRLLDEGFLSQEDYEMVDCARLAAFFASDLGWKIRSGHCLREYKFSILDDASKFDEALSGEQVLLQGVVDCALMESDGITIVDFKTDRVTEENLHEVSERYRIQLETYADAMQRIYEMPVKEKYLYFFRLNRFVRI